MECRSALANDHARVVTPYKPYAWERALHECNLRHKYPNLIHNLIYGSPIGSPPPLSRTFIPPNMPSAFVDLPKIDMFIEEELNSSQMSGPVSFEEALEFFNGPFHTASIGLIEKPPDSGKWRMIRNFSATDEFRVSTNNWLDSDDFPIMWHSCSVIADFVHSFIISLFVIHCLSFPVVCLHVVMSS
jgi:hypothetical protein